MKGGKKMAGYCFMDKEWLTLQQIRLKLGMTQRAFADYFEIPLRTLERWEAGRSDPPVYVVHLVETVARYYFPGKFN